MEINAAVRQTVAPPGVVRPARPPEGAVRSGRTAGDPSDGVSRELVKALAGEAGAVAPGESRLRVDESTDRIVLEVLNEKREVVKQIPPEALLKALARSRDITGLLLDKQS